MGKITAYCRIGCPHSDATKYSLEQIKTSYPNANIEIIPVENNELAKNSIKRSLSSIIGSHSTFPIVLYTKTDNKTFLVGGNDKFQELLSKAKNIFNSPISEQNKQITQNMSGSDTNDTRFVAGLLVMFGIGK